MEQDCISRAIEWLFKDNILKDYVWPLIIGLIGVIAAYIIFKIQENIKAEEVNKEKLFIINSVKPLKTSCLSTIELVLTGLKREKESFNIRDFKDFNYMKYELTSFNSIISLGYDKLYRSFIISEKFNEKSFLQFWFGLNNTTANIKHIQDYVDYLATNYNKVNSELNGVTKKISVKVLDVIESVFPAFSTTEINCNSMTPKQCYAFRLLTVVKEFQESREPHFIKLKSFLENLDKFRFIKEDGLLMSPSLAQEIVEANSIIVSIERLLEIASSSYGNYIDQFEKIKDQLKNMDF